VNKEVFTGIHAVAFLGMCSYLHGSGEEVCGDDDYDDKEINTAMSYEDTCIHKQTNKPNITNNKKV
jgi:hypothetical protein